MFHFNRFILGLVTMVSDNGATGTSLLRRNRVERPPAGSVNIQRILTTLLELVQILNPRGRLPGNQTKSPLVEV